MDVHPLAYILNVDSAGGCSYLLLFTLPSFSSIDNTNGRHCQITATRLIRRWPEASDKYGRLLNCWDCVRLWTVRHLWGNFAQCRSSDLSVRSNRGQSRTSTCSWSMQEKSKGCVQNVLNHFVMVSQWIWTKELVQEAVLQLNVNHNLVAWWWCMIWSKAPHWNSNWAMGEEANIDRKSASKQC